ncbi:MAG: hypothetical protein ABIL07_08075 [candidate division WOR-3 bacterium]
MEILLNYWNPYAHGETYKININKGDLIFFSRNDSVHCTLVSYFIDDLPGNCNGI